MLIDDLKKYSEIFKDFPYPWFICGGWAVDLFVGNKTREHEDVEIGIFRESQFALQECLRGYHFFYFEKGEKDKKSPWLKGRKLELPIHEIWAEKDEERIEILLNEAESEKWIYRRDNRITLPLNNLEGHSEIGLKYLTPEVVLLYKSKYTRPKDDIDFNTIEPYLNKQQRQWLFKAISTTQPSHHWISRLIS